MPGLRHALVPGWILALALVAVFVAPPAGARPAPPEPLKVGDLADHELATPHPYPPGDPSGPVVWRQELKHPGATYMTVFLDRMELAPGDHLAILDAGGKEQERLLGRGPRGDGRAVWTPAVDGETVILELHAFGGGTDAERYGLAASRYAHGFAPLVSVDEVCGSDNRRDAKCYQSSYPTEYAKGRAVGRMLIQGVYFCTAWLVSCQGHMLTNNHCADTEAEVEASQIRMMYERSGCGTGNATWDRTLTGRDMLKTSIPLDYTLFTINESAPEYGFLGLDPRLPEPGERIYIPAHHDGDVKRFGIESDGEPQGVIRVSEAPYSNNADDIMYFADTTGGSSGSPVLAASTNRVVALHHTASIRCLFGNHGVRMDLVYPQIKPLLPACSFSPDMLFVSYQVLDGMGNNNGHPDPGETFRLAVTVKNRGTLPATSVVGTLGTTLPEVSISDSQAAFPSIADGASATSQDPHFTLALDPGLGCGATIPLRLSLVAAEGTFVLDFALRVGHNLGGPVVYASSDTPLPIPDDNDNGITSTITVPQSFTIADAYVQPRITHPYSGDLFVDLASPVGTSVRLHAQTGWGRDGLDDWYDRDVPPDGPGTMSDFDGQNSAGAWVLHVTDPNLLDAGTLDGWTLELHRPDNFVCQPAGQTPGEPSDVAAGDAPLRVTGYSAASGLVTVTFAPACGILDHAAYSGPLTYVGSYLWDHAHCALGNSGSAQFAPGYGSRFFVVVGQAASSEGSYGRRSNGTERPEATGIGTCDLPQDLANPCP
ncbi:MAG: trypsin-like peptidase domain-containing protein [Acidobacteria bacterium]|nr:trypsin-like peptidase domain-containing protein [Acidobacteriota bacterium]